MCETHSEQINELAKALAAAQGELEPAERNATAAIGEKGRLSRKYADLTAMIDAVRKVLPKHGLSIAQIVLPTEGVAHVRTMLMHESGQWLASECRMPYDNTGSKNAVQSMGSAITYARRYSLSALVGVVVPRPTSSIPNIIPAEQAIAEFNACETVTALRATADRLAVPENHPDIGAIREAYRTRRKEIETGRTRAA